MEIPICYHFELETSEDPYPLLYLFLCSILISFKKKIIEQKIDTLNRENTTIVYRQGESGAMLLSIHYCVRQVLYVLITIPFSYDRPKILNRVEITFPNMYPSCTG